MSEELLPKGWLKTTLGAVVDYGRAIKASSENVSAETWVLELEDIEKDSSKLLNKVLFRERKFKSAKNKFKTGDVLYGKLRPYLNKVIIAHEDGVCTTEILPLCGGNNVDNRFLFYWLKSAEFLTYTTRVGYGVNMPRLGTKDGISAPFILAPLAEQKEIARQLDDLLAQVDILKTRLDSIPAILKRFRQSTLAAAVSGKLTEEWRGAAFVWEEKPIKNFTTKIGSGSTPRGGKSAYKESGISLVRSMNIHFDRIKHEGMAYIDEEQAAKLDNATVNENDVLLNITGASIGRVNIAPKELEGARVNQHVTIIRCAVDQMHPKYLNMYLASPETQKWVIEENYGATRQALTKGMVENFLVNVPPFEEQTEIVRRVEELFAFADQVEQRVKDAQSRVNYLTQSILAKAFRGELTADWRAANPDLITGENSAEALLKRLRRSGK